MLSEIGLSEKLYDTQLSDIQQRTLRKIIEDGDFFNISLKNYESDCCDIMYYNLELISVDKVNSLSWTTANYRNSSRYNAIPMQVTNFVETLIRFTENSTRLYTESDLDAIRFQKMSAFLNNANSLLAKKNYSEAILGYDKVLALDPNQTDALVYKAHALTSLGQHEEALSLVDRVLNLYSNDSYDIFDKEALTEKAVILANLDRQEEAITWINKALGMDSGNDARALILKKKIEEKIK